ncbi:fibroblast growth factor binding protein 2a [Salminus brasiliensis]|uniref:fibroblast growth factor binding protein 2a n=1 Tax=Salminus brasiliensis TaxID=930266 RepID=UPI003B835417
MRTLASALMLSCCFWASLVESYEEEEEQRRSMWEEPIQFATKAKDQCSMMVTGQGELTKLRISCQSQGRSYWCEYQGRPHICRAYNNNPRHFFTQIMWDLRKLRNACQGKSVLKSFMCRKASDEAQMVFATSSTSYDVPSDGPVQSDAMETPTTRQETNPWEVRPDYPTSDQARPEQVRPSKPSRAQPGRSGQARTDQRNAGSSKPGNRPRRPVKVVRRKMSTPTTTAPPTTATGPAPAPISKAKRLAQQHCWPSLQSACAYVIGWFTY